MIEIDNTSEAGRFLAKAYADPDTYKVSLAIKPGPRITMIVKVNEGIWTAPMSGEPCKHLDARYDGPGLTLTCHDCGTRF